MKRVPKFVPYKSKKNGKNYWRLIGANGQKVATGNESFVKPISEKQFRRLQQIFASAEYAPKKKK